MGRERGHEPGRHLDGPVELAAGGADQRRVCRAGQAGAAIALELVEQAAESRVDQVFVGQPGQSTELLPARGRPAGWHVGRLVPMQHRGGMAQVADRLPAGFQLGERVGHGTRCSRWDR